MDVDLPVWTIRPNWKDGVLERLEWLTEILASETGVEQRRGLRLSPRRSFEITVNPTRNDRTYLDLVLHRLGSERWLFPLWHDQAKLGSNIGVGIDTLDIDNTFREFRPGDYAILYQDTFTWEAVMIADTTAGTLELTGGVEKAWPRGTKIYPMRIARIQTDTSLSALTSRVGQSVLLFQCEGANDFPEMMGDAMVQYDGSPLITIAPNRSQEITTAHTRLFDEADGSTGIVERKDLAGRAFAVQSHNWQAHGREAQMAFRSFLYSLRGRQRRVWLPTFNDDVTVAANTTAAGKRIDIEKVGLAYVSGGNPIPGRERLWSGTEVARITAISGLTGTDRERLATLNPLEGIYAPGDAWSFLQPARLDQDSIEIHHYADSDGVFEVAAGFRTFADERIGTGANVPPALPPAEQSDEPCGTPFGINPCFAVKPDWSWRIFWHRQSTSPDNSPHCGGMSNPNGLLWTAMTPDHQNWRYGFETNEDYPVGTYLRHVAQTSGGCIPASAACGEPWPSNPAQCTVYYECVNWRAPGSVIVMAKFPQGQIFPVDFFGLLGVPDSGGLL